MAGFLGKAPLASDASFFLELAVLAILIFAKYDLARTNRIRQHGVSLMIAVSLHVISVALVMIPSFARSINILFEEPSNLAVILTWIHIPLGGLALAFGLFLTFTWRLRPVSQTCFKRVSWMRPVFWLWTSSLVLGILIYLAIAFYSR